MVGSWVSKLCRRYLTLKVPCRDVDLFKFTLLPVTRMILHPRVIYIKKGVTFF